MSIRGGRGGGERRGEGGGGGGNCQSPTVTKFKRDLQVQRQNGHDVSLPQHSIVHSDIHIIEWPLNLASFPQASVISKARQRTGSLISN